MVNPSKYFTNQDVWANMPIISNCSLKPFGQGIQSSDFSNCRFHWSENVNVFVLVLNKKHTENMQLNFISCGHLFLCVMIYVNQVCDHRLFLTSTSSTSPPPQGSTTLEFLCDDVIGTSQRSRRDSSC